MCDIPDLTIGKFVAYFLPIAMIYFCSWIIFSWLGLKKQKSINYWLILVIYGVAVPYLIYLPFYKTPYMYSDSFYHFSYVKSIAKGNFLKDVIYAGYPTYYPPLYFLLLGFLMWLFKASVLDFFIYTPIFNILLICFLAYFVGQYIIDRTTGILYILMFFVFSFPAASYLTGGIRASAGLHSAIVIPHEVIAVMLLILGLFIFSREEKRDEWWSGLIGGVITLLSVNYAVYYILSLLGYTIVRTIRTKNFKVHLLRFFLVGAVTFLIASAYIIPYLSSLIYNGTDDYHWTWTILSNFDPYLITFGLGFMGVTFIMGILGIIALNRSNFKQILIITSIVLFIGRFHVYITKPLFNISYIPDHAYYALVVFLSFTGAIFLRDFPLKIYFKKWTLREVKIGHIFLVSTLFLPIFIWNPVSNNAIYQAFMPIPKKIENIASIINKKTERDEIILASKEISPWILLLTGRHLALAGDPWCSNPTARYSLRYKDFSEVFSVADIRPVKDKLDKWGVDIIVLAKENGRWIFRANSPEYGRFFAGSPLETDVDKNIFNNKTYFTKLYEDEYFVVLRND